MVTEYKRVTGKGSRKEINMEILKKAIKDVQKGISEAARKYKVPRMNISRRIHHPEGAVQKAESQKAESQKAEFQKAEFSKSRFSKRPNYPKRRSTQNAEFLKTE